MSVELGLGEQEIIQRLKKVNSVIGSLKVSFDIDGVEVNSTSTAIAKLNRNLGTNYGVGDLVSYWSMVDLVKKARPGIEDPKQYAINLWNSDDVFGVALPELGSWILSKYLDEIKIGIYRVTSRPSSVSDVTFDWYRRFMPWVNPELIHIQKGQKHNARFKADTISGLGVELHFDDSVEDAKYIVSRTSARVVLIPQPWNLNREIAEPRILISNVATDDPAKLFRVYLDLFGRI